MSGSESVTRHNVSLVDQSFWDSHYAESRLHPYDESRVRYKEVFDKYLRPGGTCFEIGFLPGDYLTYLSKRFHYVVSGVDLTPFTETEIREKLSGGGATVGRLINGDFLSLGINQTFDVVCSFGFLEHFEDTDEIIRRHVELVRPGGTLVISCPNFTGGQYVLHYYLDRRNLMMHNLAAMDLHRWKRTLEASGMEILFQGYQGTFSFWTECSKDDSLIKRGIAYSISRLSGWVDVLIKRPNRVLSASMISVSRKRD